MFGRLQKRSNEITTNLVPMAWCYTTIGNRFGVTNFLFLFGFYRSTPSPLALFFPVDRFGPKRTLIIVNTGQVYLGTGYLTGLFVLDWFREKYNKGRVIPSPPPLCSQIQIRKKKLTAKSKNKSNKWMHAWVFVCLWFFFSILLLWHSSFHFLPIRSRYCIVIII